MSGFSQEYKYKKAPYAWNAIIFVPKKMSNNLPNQFSFNFVYGKTNKRVTGVLLCDGQQITTSTIYFGGCTAHPNPL